jgi:hypothetical protein
VEFTTEPPGAEVHAGQKLLCVTPCIAALPTGKNVRILLQKRGLKTRSLMINPGQDRVVDVILHRTPRTAPVTKTKTGQPALRPWLD